MVIIPCTWFRVHRECAPLLSGTVTETGPDYAESAPGNEGVDLLLGQFYGIARRL